MLSRENKLCTRCLQRTAGHPGPHLVAADVSRLTLILLFLLLFATRCLSGERVDTNASPLPVCYLVTTNPVVSDRKVACTFAIDYAGVPGQPGSNLIGGSVRIHGGVSQSFPKKSYGLTLATPIAPPSIHPTAHWVLNAAYIDRSLMRHKLAYDLFLSLAEPDAPRHASASRFVELYLNGKYNGAYLLMERVDWR